MKTIVEFSKGAIESIKPPKFEDMPDGSVVLTPPNG